MGSYCSICGGTHEPDEPCLGSGAAQAMRDMGRRGKGGSGALPLRYGVLAVVFFLLALLAGWLVYSRAI